jgi:hypothetical protein
MFTQKQKDRFLGAISILITSCIIYLTTSFFESFASKAEVDIIKSSLLRIESLVAEMQKDIRQLLLDTKKP